MTILKAKLCSLNDADTRSITSMLSVANDHLSSQWQLVKSEDADLYIYSFDTEEGIDAWHQHNPQKISALLSTQDETGEAIDIIIKKPLRTKNFSHVLNEAEQKIGATVKQQTHAQKKKSSNSLFSSLFSGFLGNKNNSSEPQLNLPIPDKQSTSGLKAITDINALKKWLISIESKDDDTKAEDIASNLLPLNQSNLATAKRFALLELYTAPIYHLVSKQYSDRHKLKQQSHTDYIKAIHTLNLLIEELINGYQYIVNDEQQHHKKPKRDSLLLTVINRIAEFTALSILHANTYYLSAPKNSINKLHQLYLYCEYFKAVDIEVATSKAEPSTFKHIYASLLLFSIANPSRLSEHDIVRVAELMNKFADKVEIKQIQVNADQSSSSGLHSGCFKLNMSQDNLPVTMSDSELEQLSNQEIRLFDTQAILTEIEGLFQQDTPSYDLQLLKKIIPQLNAYYTRRFERKACNDKPKIDVLMGISAIHQYLTTQSLSKTYPCIVRNRGKGGMMISSETLDCYYLSIGNIIGVVDKNNHRLAVVRWMSSSNDGMSHIGIEFLPDPTPIKLNIESKTNAFIGLILPVQTGGTSTNTIIVDRETYIPLQTISISDGQNTYKIAKDESIENNFNCEQFSFSIKSN
jgi:hypothetical protein